MEKILDNTYAIAIETSGRVGSACLSHGPRVLEEILLSGRMRHGSELMPAIEDLLKRHGLRPADIGLFYFPIGPGSFTGLRIAVTMAKMLAFALPVRLIAVNTLDAVAQNATEYMEQTGQRIERAAAVLDAKKDLFHAAVYQRRGADWEKTAGDLMIPAHDLVDRYGGSEERKLYLLGEGLVYYRDKFISETTAVLPEPFWPAAARNIFKTGWKKALAGDFADPDTLVPLYIRRPEAVEKWESRSK